MNVPFISARSSDGVEPLRRFAVRGRSQDGTTLIEVIVAVLLLSIAMTMTVIIVGVLTKNVAATANTGTSADAAQSAIQTLASYVSGAVPPVSAASAELSPYTTLQVTAPTSPCWGGSNVSSEEGSTLYGWPSGASTIPVNETIGVIYAHDFNMEFCGYGSDASGTAASALPSVYEIFVNTGACSNNYCPLDIVSYGSAPFQPNGVDYEPANPLTAGTLVASVGRVWCDTACRTLGVSCQSIDTAVGQGMPTSSLPSNYTSLCVGVPSSYTPPLFSYYSSTGAGSGATALNWVNAYTTVGPPANVNLTPTASCASAVQCAGPIDLYSFDDSTFVDEIHTIVLNITVLGQDNPSGSSASKTNVQIKDQIWLRSLGS